MGLLMENALKNKSPIKKFVTLINRFSLYFTTTLMYLIFLHIFYNTFFRYFKLPVYLYTKYCISIVKIS